MKKVLFFAAAVVFGFAGAGLAQNATETEGEIIKQDSVYLLPRVKVVARAIVEENTTEKTATQVTRISAEQIKDLNAQDLPSAIRRVPGVMISRHNLVGSYGGAEGGSIYIRGMGSGRPGASIQMLVDGVPNFVGVWTHPVLDVLSVDNLDQIEIYKSPRPVLWGNMSFGAVNLVSRRMTSEGFRSDLNLMYGSYNTYGTVFNHGGKQGAFDYYFGAGVKGSDGAREMADGQLRHYWGRLGYELSETWDATLILNSSNNWAQDPGPVTGPLPRRARFKTDDYTLNFTLANRGPKLNGFFRLYRDDGKINWEDWDTALDDWTNSNTDYLNQGLRIQQHILLARNTELTLGFDYDSYGGSFVTETPGGDSPMPEKYFFNTALYGSLVHGFNLAPDLILTPSLGVRVNHHNVFDSEVAPEAGLLLQGPKWSLNANYARGFNYAGVYTVYNYTWWGRGEQYRDLEPEHVRHFELGFQFKPVSTATVDLTVFHDRGENLIRFVPPPPPPPLFANVDKFRNTGLEASVNWYPMDRLAVFAGVTAIKTDPDNFPQAPDYMLTLGGNLSFLRRFRLSLDLEAVGERYVSNPRYDMSDKPLDPYVIANAKLSYYFEGTRNAHRGANLFIGVENLTDTAYEYKPGYPMPGAAASFGLALNY